MRSLAWLLLALAPALASAQKKPFDPAAWRAGLEQYRDIPFMEDGRDQGTIVEDDDAAALT